MHWADAPASPSAVQVATKQAAMEHTGSFTVSGNARHSQQSLIRVQSLAVAQLPAFPSVT
jgi:hypothetical protein